jgi:hypothetical protein
LLHVVGRFIERDQVPLFFGNANADQFSLCRSQIGGSRALQRLPARAPQVSEVGNAALIEREAVTLPWITPSASSLLM